MITNIYIAKGCIVNYQSNRDASEFEFNLGTYANYDLALKAVEAELDRRTQAAKNFRFPGGLRVWLNDDTTLYKFVIETITFES